MPRKKSIPTDLTPPSKPSFAPALLAASEEFRKEKDAKRWRFICQNAFLARHLPFIPLAQRGEWVDQQMAKREL